MIATYEEQREEQRGEQNEERREEQHEEQNEELRSSNNETSFMTLDILADEAAKQTSLEERQPGKRKPKPTHLCSKRVQKRRHAQLRSLVEPLAKEIHGTDTNEEAFSLFQDMLNDEKAKQQKETPTTKEKESTVSVEECAIFCHRFNVNSKNYQEFKEFLKIPYSYAEIEAFYRSTQADTGLPNPKPMADGVQGHTYGLAEYLRYFFTKNGYSVNKTNRIKIAADGGTLSSKKSKYEIGTFESADEANVDKLRSHKNSHVIFMYWGDESRDNLRVAMQRLSSDIEQLKKQKNRIKITTVVDNQPKEVEIEVEIWLTCDMACLCKVLGLCDVFHSSSKYKCPWCEVTKDTIGDFTLPHWALRSLAGMTKIGAEQEKRKTKRAGDHKGIVVRKTIFCGYQRTSDQRKSRTTGHTSPPDRT